MTTRTPFVGRKGPIEELDRAIADGARGKGSISFITGEPGIGKSRLAEEVAARAQAAGFRCLVGRCYETDAQVPFAPLVDLASRASRSEQADSFRRALGEEASEVARILPELRDRFPDLPPTVELPPGEDRRFLFESITDLLGRVARTDPILMVLEDLQFADEATLSLLEHMVPRLGQLPVVVVATYRAADVRGSHPLAKLFLQGTRRSAIGSIDLDRLEPGEVSKMLAALRGGEPPAALVTLITAVTEGNPFFIEEVAKHLKQQGRLFDAAGGWRADVHLGELEVPGSVRLAVERRLEKLSSETRDLLDLAAIAGRSLDIELLRAIGEPASFADAIDEAQREGTIVVDAHGGITFTHELVRQTIERALSPARRRVNHAAVGQALERLHPDRLTEMAGELAHHFLSARPETGAGETAAYLILAAERALGAAAFEEAMSHLQAARSLVPEDDLRSRARLLHQLGLATRGVGDWQGAITAWDEALTIAERTKDAELAGELSAAVVTQLGWAGQWLDVVRFVGRGLAAVGLRSVHRAYLLAVQGAILAGAGDHDTGAGMTEAAVRLAEGVGNERLLGQCLLAKSGRLLVGMRVTEALEVGERGARLLRSAGSLYDLAASLAPTIIAANLSGRLDRAIKLEEELTPIAERFGHHGAMFALHTQRGFRAIAQGPDIDAYEEESRRGDDLCRRVGLIASMHVGPAQLGLVDMWRGRWGAAADRFREAIGLEPPGALSGSCAGLLVLALAYDGRTDELHAELDERRPTMPVAGRVNGIGAWTTLLGAVEALAVVGDRAASAAFYPFVLQGIDEGALFRQWDLRSLHTLAGLSAGCGEDWGTAERHFRVALEQAESLPVRLEAAEARRFYAGTLVARGGKGDGAAARKLIDEATDVYARAGMHAHVALTRSLLGV